jgi:hypothetical protein
LVNEKLLREKMAESGYKMQFIAEKCGLTYQGLLNKINNVRAFKTTEAGILKDLLKLSDDEFNAIFFADNVGCETT